MSAANAPTTTSGTRFAYRHFMFSLGEQVRAEQDARGAEKVGNHNKSFCCNWTCIGFDPTLTRMALRRPPVKTNSLALHVPTAHMHHHCTKLGMSQAQMRSSFVAPKFAYSAIIALASTLLASHDDF